MKAKLCIVLVSALVPVVHAGWGDKATFHTENDTFTVTGGEFTTTQTNLGGQNNSNKVATGVRVFQNGGESRTEYKSNGNRYNVSGGKFKATQTNLGGKNNQNLACSAVECIQG